MRPPLRSAGGRITLGTPTSVLPPAVAAVDRIRADMVACRFYAPEASRLAEVGLDRRAIGAAVRAGELQIADGLVLLPGADAEAAAVLAGLPQPFTASEARQALGTTRRTVIPLLEHLDWAGHTELSDGARRCRAVARGGW